MKRHGDEGLWKDDALFVLASDHSCPLNGTVLSLPGYPSEQLGRIPMAFLTPQRLPEVPLTVRASQLDLAPKSEIVYLEDERGRQMFPANQDSPFVRLFNTLLVRPGQ